MKLSEFLGTLILSVFEIVTQFLKRGKVYKENIQIEITILLFNLNIPLMVKI